MDENKKPGPRDISDLKARLGLKKTGTMPAAAPNTTPPTGQPPFAPAPGFGAPPAEPPAPFARPAEPQAFAPAPEARRNPFAPQPAAEPDPRRNPFAPQPAAEPDPRRDPFAAQQQQAANLAAYYGLGQALPGSADGVSSASISKPKVFGKLLVVGIAGVAGLVIGNTYGRIQRDRVEYNQTTEQAGQIHKEVEGMAKQLSSITDLLDSSKATLQGKVDLAMTAKLGALDLKKPETKRIFHTNYASLDPMIVDRLMSYYDNTLKLYNEITEHAKKTENDKDAITRVMNSGAVKNDKNYGVIVEPMNGLMLAKFVEVGTPVCSDPSKTDCSAKDLRGFKFRMDSGSAWGQRPVKGHTEQIVMPIQQSPLFKAVAAGNPDFLAFKDYARRMAEIRQLTITLMNQQKDLLSDLKKASQRPMLTTF